jgi:uncharacterized protein (TIGR02284 family)
MEDNSKIIEVLNDLIKINADRITGYEKAAGKVENSEVMLKSLFYQISDESQEIKERLIDKVVALGGIPADESTAAGKVYHTWIEGRPEISNHNATSILENCEFGEDAAQRAYQDAVEESKTFPEDVSHMIRNQQHLLKMSHDLIRNQRLEVNG